VVELKKNLGGARFSLGKETITVGAVAALDDATQHAVIADFL
jgi:hypothetical protein